MASASEAVLVVQWAPWVPRLLHEVQEPHRAAALAHGRRCAAWVLQHNEATLQREGRVCFTLQRGQRLPAWAEAAFDVLAADPAWQVDEAHPGRQTVHHVVRLQART